MKNVVDNLISTILDILILKGYNYSEVKVFTDDKDMTMFDLKEKVRVIE